MTDSPTIRSHRASPGVTDVRLHRAMVSIRRLRIAVAITAVISVVSAISDLFFC